MSGAQLNGESPKFGLIRLALERAGDIQCG